MTRQAKIWLALIIGWLFVAVMLIGLKLVWAEEGSKVENSIQIEKKEEGYGKIKRVYITYGTASWYSVDSCKREGTCGIMANGVRLDDSALTCAIWDLPFGTLVSVTNLENNKVVVCKVTDRGPAKRLVQKGRIIDLSKASFAKIANLKKNIIKVRIEYEL